ncbi:MAG: TIR domain-containing protein [Sphingomicrobium sp.]
MADVFISYARSTNEEAERVAQALRATGYSVWRDDELPAHRTYADVIEERLKSAKAVVVIWSAEAAKSQWVRAEADAARELGTLVQISIDGTVPPMPFNQIQCASLNGWEGDVSAAGWKKVEASVAALVGDGAGQHVPSAGQRPRERSICVLPFANMSGDAEQEYFSDGISEDITTDLSKVSALAVVARNTAFTFKGQSVNVSEVASKLGVSHVLEGSVRKVADRVRITAQLIDGGTGDHLWAERYDRDLTDIFAIQDEISKAIVDALKVKLLPDERRAIEDRGTSDADAYNLYLMARQYWTTGNHGDPSREERVIRLCLRAVAIDPSYAQAWALLAIAQSNLKLGFGRGGESGLDAAQRAQALDPTIAEAYCVTAHQLSERGLHDEAIAEIEKGLRLKTDSWEVNKMAARTYMRAGKVEAGAACYERAVAVMETDYHAWGMLVTCYRSTGDAEKQRHAAEKALGQVERVLAEDPSNGAAISFGVSALACLGEEERAREWMERGMLIDPDNLNMHYNFACMLAADLNDGEAALDILEVTIPKVKGSFGMLERDPDLESIRDNPRYVKLVADANARLAAKAAADASPGEA